MKNSTKFISSFTAAILALSLASCGNVTDPEPAANTNANTSAAAPEEPAVTTTTGEQPADPASASKAQTPDVKTVSMTEKQKLDFTKGSFDFSAELFKQCALSDDNANTLVSPGSAMFALGMTANGARDKTSPTLSEMLAVLGGDSDLETLNAGLQNTYAHQSTTGVLSNANSIWIKDGFDISDDFITACGDLCGAEVSNISFDEGTADIINDWINRKTNGMIPEALDEVPPNAVMYLVNATAFDDKWKTAYEDYQCRENMTFTAADGTEQDATMLYSTERSYIEGENVTGFIKPYENGFSFMALLPDENVPMTDFISSLDGDKLMELYNSQTNSYDVDAAIPEFSFDCDYLLNDPLQSMGMVNAFGELADFGGISETAAYGIDGAFRISRVIQKTHIGLDREGTKAAAATVVEMETDGIEPEKETKAVHLDRPFVFSIIDTTTGIPVFMGTVNTLS